MTAVRKSCQRSETALAIASAKAASDRDPSRPGAHEPQTTTGERRAAFRPTSVAGFSKFGFQPNRSTPP